MTLYFQIFIYWWLTGLGIIGFLVLCTTPGGDDLKAQSEIFRARFLNFDPGAWLTVLLLSLVGIPLFLGALVHAINEHTKSKE